MLPCYQHFEGKCTAGSSCVYSHDPAVLTTYAKEQLQRLLRSKYITADEIVRTAREKSQNVVRPVPSQPTQDARRLPAGRGPGNLRVLTRTADVAQVTDASTDQG